MVLHLIATLVIFVGGGYCGYKYGSKLAADVKAVEGSHPAAKPAAPAAPASPAAPAAPKK